MKRAVSVITTLLLAIGIFSGCQKNQGVSDFKNSGVTKHDSTIFSDFWDKDGTESITADIITLKDGTQFSEGIALICYNYFPIDNELRYGAINSEGKILFDISRYEYEYCQYRDATFQNGILVGDNVIYDTSGKVIASPEISGYDKLCSENCNGYVFASKIEESYKGDVYKVGVLNNLGNWEYPLSEDHPIAKLVSEKTPLFSFHISDFDDYRAESLPDTIVKFRPADCWEDYYYNIEKNIITNSYAHHGKIDRYSAGPIYEFDDSGSMQEIIADSISDLCLLKNAFLAKYENQENVWVLYDYDGMPLMDLSGYNIVSVGHLGDTIQDELVDPAYYNKHLLAVIDNGNGNRYLCLFNQDSEPIFEPIKWDDYSDTCFSLDDTGFVYKQRDGADYAVFHCDYAGKITQFENVIDLENSGEELYLVQYEDNRFAYINHLGEELVIKIP